MDNSLVFDRYYNSSLRFLSYRPRSEKEVYDYLKKKAKRAEALEEIIIAQIMRRLIELNFINDLEFAKFWIEHRKKAFSLLKMELLQKGVSKETILEAASEFDIDSKQEKLIEKLIEKKMYLPYEKLVAYLIRRGFSYEEIRKHLKS